MSTQNLARHRRLLRAIFLGLALIYIMSLTGAGLAVIAYEKNLGESSPIQAWLNQNATSYSIDIYDAMLALKEVSIAYREANAKLVSPDSQSRLTEKIELLESVLRAFEPTTSTGRLINTYESAGDAMHSVAVFIGSVSESIKNKNTSNDRQILVAEQQAFIAMRKLTIEAERKEFQARDEMVSAINSSRMLADRALYIGIALFVFGLIALFSVYMASKAWMAAERNRFDRLEYLLSTVGHDLRSPLQAIISCAQLLQKSHAVGCRQNYLNIIKDSSEQLARLVDDLVGLTRNEDLHFESHPLDLVLWLNKIAARYTVEAERKGLTLRITTGSSALPIIMFDETRLTQCVGNLLSNAIRYTNAGSIHLTIDHHQTSCENGEILIQVEDTGTGIPDRDRERIFRPFVRLSSEPQGTGLGLAIASSIVRAAKGKIFLKTAEGVGSTFSVRLPIEYPKTIASESTPRPDNFSRVLIVGDDPSVRTTFAGMISDMGYLSDLAADVEEALLLATTKTFHAIITDIQMPGVDGFQLAQQCREALHPCPILIAITAYTKALNADPRSTLFDKILYKPINDELLLAALESQS
ncbi:signal transduction histidine kinase [Oxalobacteraceae bacterium GrIS 2.11]